MLTSIRERLIDRTIGCSRLQNLSTKSLTNIQKKVKNSALEPKPSQFAWGQYLERPHDYNQKGVYGTSAAIQILSLKENPPYPEIVKGGQDWLIEKWNDPDSRISKEYHQAIIYKHVDYLNSLLPSHRKSVSEVIDETEEKYLDAWEKSRESLLNKRVDWQGELTWGNGSGWGEYHYTEMETLPKNEGDIDTPAKLLPTSYALYALATSTEDPMDMNHIDSLLELAERVIEQEPEKNDLGRYAIATRTALCLLALGIEYRTRGSRRIEELSSKKAKVAKRLENIINGGQNMGPHLYYDHFFTTPSPKFDNHYIIFLFNPIISLALIEAGPKFVGRNWSFISNTIETFCEEIGTNEKTGGAYTAKKTGLQATRDHLWISKCLFSFSKIQLENLRLRDIIVHGIRQKIKRKSVLFFLFLSTVAIASYSQYFSTEPLNITISSILYVISGAILREIGLPQWIKNRFGI